MDVKVHRGSDQIGGSIVEIATASTRILLDAGTELDAEDDAPLPIIDGLFVTDTPKHNAVFFSHNHLDHIGLAKSIHPDIPLFIGEKALAVSRTMADYLGKPLGFTANTYQHNTPVEIGDMTITPFIIDHSAFDAYMLLVESGEEKILYSGDFRSTGRKSFPRELRCLPSKINTLICEGTNLGGEEKPSISESDLEEQAVELFRKHKGPVFVLQASANIDRLVTMYRAAKRSGRVFIEDLYTAEIARAAAPSIPNPDFDDVRVFIDRYYDDNHPRYISFDKYGAKKIARADIARLDFVLCIRVSMGKLLRSLSHKMDFYDGLMVYSMWNGYREKPQMAGFLKLSTELGLNEVYLHNSGHADATTIDALIGQVNPDRIIPVHTKNARWFERYKNRGIEARAGKKTDLVDVVDVWRDYNHAITAIAEKLGSTTNIIGEMAERLVCSWCGGELLGFSHKSADIRRPDGKLIQVKARRMKHLSSTQLSAFRSWDFDFLVVVIFSLRGDVLRAIQMDSAVAQECASQSDHVNASIITTSKNFLFNQRAEDITIEIQALLAG